MDHTSAKAAADAGYLSLVDYLALCSEHGWAPDTRIAAA